MTREKALLTAIRNIVKDAEISITCNNKVVFYHVPAHAIEEAYKYAMKVEND